MPTDDLQGLLGTLCPTTYPAVLSVLCRAVLRCCRLSGEHSQLQKVQPVGIGSDGLVALKEE